MILIDTERLPRNLDPGWTRRTGMGLRLLFWATFVVPFLSSLGEFWVRMVMQLMGSKDADGWAIQWATYSPVVTLVATAIAALGVWVITSKAHLKEAHPGATGRLIRPVVGLWLVLCTVDAAASLSGFRLSSEIYLWFRELCLTATAVLLFVHMGALADRLDQYPIQAMTRVMILYVVGRIITRILGILLAGTAVGAVVNPVLAIGEIALSLVTIVGVLIAAGRLHRVIQLASVPSENTQ